jgi:hypothetical protein
MQNSWSRRHEYWRPTYIRTQRSCILLHGKVNKINKNLLRKSDLKWPGLKLDLQKFPVTSTLTAMLKYGFSSKYSSLFFLRHAHVLQILNFYMFSQRKRQALEHVCCQLDKLELSYSSWVMGSLTWSLYTYIQTDRQTDRQKKGC